MKALLGGLWLAAMIALVATWPRSSTEPTAQQVQWRQGLKTYATYCMACHSLGYQRNSEVASDLGLDDDALRTLLPGATPGAPMTALLDPAQAAKAYGIAPPDLTLIAKVRGSDWLRDYLHGFYEDPSRPLGVDNQVAPGTRMPNILGPLQGRQRRECQADSCALHLQPGSGSLAPERFAALTDDLIAFLRYSAEPGRYRYQHLGYWVVAYLLAFSLFAGLLVRALWRDPRMGRR